MLSTFTQVLSKWVQATFIKTVILLLDLILATLLCSLNADSFERGHLLQRFSSFL